MENPQEIKDWFTNQVVKRFKYADVEENYSSAEKKYPNQIVVLLNLIAITTDVNMVFYKL